MNHRRRRHSWPEWPSDPTPSFPVVPGRPSIVRRFTARQDLSHDVLKQQSLAEIAGTANIDQLECVKAVQRGAELCKYGHRGSPHFRFFYVDATGSMLQWWSHKKRLEDTIVNFSDVQRLQVGQHTLVFQRFAKYRTKELKRRSFSLIYGPDGEKSLDVVCSSREEFLVWARALRFLITRVSNTKKIDPYRSLLLSSWNRAFVREGGVIDADAVSRLLFDMNINFSKAECKTLFESANVNRHDLIDFSTMTRLSLRVRSSPSAYSEIFRPYADPTIEKLTVNLKEFIFFLRTEQQMDIEESEGLTIMSKFITKEGGRNPPRLRIYELILYLMDEDNTLFDPQRMALYQDMTRPLTDYFINSSHNTYLESDQLKGASSTKMYVKALQEGCRSVEIDCWDGPNGEPVVYHGFTLTSRVLFRDVIQTVSDHAFDASPFPVTLSFENHCSLPFQRQMAHHLKTILGDKIAYPQDYSRILPSPESLKYRIIIKAKFFFDNEETPPIPATPVSTASSFTEFETTALPSPQYNERRIAPELASLVLLQAKKFVSFDQLRGASACQMTSFSEKKVAKLVKKGLAGRFVCYNSQNLSRVYPSQFRVDSSNFDPFQAWTLGCQMVALNFQTADLPKLMNIGRFMENANCGYVLKPEQLRRFSTIDLSDHEDDYEQTISMSSGSNFVFTHITLTIIGAFHLPKPAGNAQNDIIDPYVKICIRGLTADYKEFKTGVVLRNGFNPTWNQTFDIGVNGPHCAMICFQIFDKKKYQDKVIAQAAVPFGCIRLGYRNVPLLSATLQKIPFCNLIVRTCKAK